MIAFNIRILLNLILKAFIIIWPSLLLAQPAYDLKLEKPVAIAPYKIWQKDQVYGFGGMANVKNVGTQPLLNPKLRLDIYNSGTGLIWSDTMLYTGTNIPMSGFFYNNSIDTYKGKYTVYQDSADFNFADNEVEFEWRISDSIMAKEDIKDLNNAKQVKVNYAWGNIYYISKDTAENGKSLVCSSVQIGLGNVYQLASQHDFMFSHLYKWNDLNLNSIFDDSELLSVGSGSYTFKPGDPNNEIYTIKMYDSKTFEQGIQLEANSTYILVLYNDQSLPSTMYVMADQKLDYSLTALRDSITQQYNFGHHVIWGNNGSFELGTYDNSVPIIRMVITPKVYKSYISGKVFLDHDCDGIYNNQDEPLEDQVILEKFSAFKPVKTDENGNYKIRLDNKGIFDFTAVNSKNVSISPPAYIIENDTLGKQFINKDFGFCFINNYHDLEAVLGVPSQPKLGSTNNFDICIKNNGSQYENAKLKLFFTDPNAAIYTSYNDTQGGTVSGPNLTWDISNLRYLTEICKKVKLYIKPGTPIGTFFKPHVQIVYDSFNLDITPLNNEVEETLEVVDKIKPYEKTVNKLFFTDADLLSGIDLEYTVHFQNTDENWYAENVEVIDTIKYPLDIGKFEMLSASDDYLLTINGNILKWTFDNIYLDQFDEMNPNSIGYIKYRIGTKENLTEQDLITNSASIYFDNNLPEFTNTAKTKFSSLNLYDLDVELTTFTQPRPGFEIDYNVCTTNLGKYEEKAKLQFDFKGGIADTYTQIIGTDGGFLTGHTVTWDLYNFDYLQTICKKVTVKVLATTPLGTIFTPHAFVKADTGIIESTLLNNEIEYNEVVVGSYDPNNKTVNKKGFTESELEEGVSLEYIIRFQNTGNYPASFIEIYDTIQGNVNMDNFEMLSASHEYTLTIIDGHILKWRFDNINLPDSTANEADSHGYIKFKITTKENLTKQDVISNSAAIYFDFNPPVFTDPAITKYAGLTSIYSLNKENLQLNIFPNPTNDKAKLQFDLPKKMDCKLEIRDVAGKLVFTNDYKGRSKGLNEELVDLSEYSSGVYLIRIISNELSGEVKLVKR